MAQFQRSRERRHMVDHAQENLKPTAGKPAFSIINRFVISEAADLVYRRSLQMIATTSSSRLEVKRITIGDVTYVAVLGEVPDAALRKSIAGLFALGRRVYPTEEYLQMFLSRPVETIG